MTYKNFVFNHEAQFETKHLSRCLGCGPKFGEIPPGKFPIFSSLRIALPLPPSI